MTQKIISFLDEKTYFDVGISFYRKKNYQKSYNYLQKAISINPNFFEAHFYLSAIYEITGNLDEAIKEFEFLIKLKPDDDELKEFMYNFYMKKKLFFKAFKIAKYFCRKNDKDSNHWLRVTEVLFLKNKFSMTEKILKNLHTVIGDDEEILLKICLNSRERKDFDRARYFCSKLLEISPESPVYNYFMGTIFEGTNENKQAKYYFDKSFNILNTNQFNDELCCEIYKRLCDLGF